jgi:Tfp pilus assembly protein PilV
MKRTLRSQQSTRGASFIELLMAGLILTIGLMALVQIWTFSFRVTTNSDDLSNGYTLGSQRMESIRVQGFASAPEGATTLYYDGNQNAVAENSASKRYRVTTTIVSDFVSSGTAGQSGAVPADNALRTVTIAVTRLVDSYALYSTSTYLVKEGV